MHEHELQTCSIRGPQTIDDPEITLVTYETKQALNSPAPHKSKLKFPSPRSLEERNQTLATRTSPTLRRRPLPDPALPGQEGRHPRSLVGFGPPRVAADGRVSTSHLRLLSGCVRVHSLPVFHLDRLIDRSILLVIKASTCAVGR